MPRHTRYNRTINELINDVDYLTDSSLVESNLDRLIKTANARLYNLKKQDYGVPVQISHALNDNDRFIKAKTDNLTVIQNQTMQIARFLNSDYSSAGKMNRNRKKIAEKLGREISPQEFKSLNSKIGYAWGALLKERDLGQVESDKVHQFFQENGDKDFKELVTAGLDYVLQQQNIAEEERKKIINEFKDKDIREDI